VNEFSFKFETCFFIVSCLSCKIVSGVGWYVESGSSKHMASNKKAFNKLQEKEASMLVELVDNAMYPVAGVGSISF
jgi:hypothetical protein